MADNRPLALSVEKVRHEMLRGLLIPREMVNKALLKTYGQLDAKETKFFSYKGVVVNKVDVDAHEVQAAAADKIFSLAGLYARERESRTATPGIAMEVDPRTGVVRLIVGDVGSPAITEGDPQTIELPPVQASPAEALVVNHAHDASSLAPIRPRSTRATVSVSDKLWKLVSDETVDE